MARRRIRMAELSRESGVSRETIHYYMREGLLPQPIKAGRTLSFYDDSHVERLRLIRRLREEKYLPLAVIRRMIAAGPERPHARDLDTLADVLGIDPTLSRLEAPATTPDEEATRTARELGLLGAARGAAPGLEPAEARVLGAVAEALALEGAARDLTLADMQACVGELTRLVEREAALFFDAVCRTGDMTRSVGALRVGRAPVARFINAFRDLMLRRIVEDILTAIARGPRVLDQTPLVPLGAARLRQLGADARRAGLVERARAGDAASASDLAWMLFSVGPPGELIRLPPAVRELLRPRAWVLVEAVQVESEGADPDSLERALERAGPFALGEVLLAEARLARCAGDAAADDGFLDRIVPALRGLAMACPGTDADPLASACAYHRRGRIGLALPRVLGWRERAVADLESALEAVLGAPGRVDPAAAALIEGNSRLSLARVCADDGRVSVARDHLERARAVDPGGPIGAAAAAALAELPAG